MMITIDTWLYGELAQYGGAEAGPGFANLKVQLPQGATVQDLLDELEMPTEERGITFVNGNLSAMPGKQPDLDLVLKNQDRVAFFHLRAMWPYQYRHGAAVLDELEKEINKDKDGGLHHSYEK
jgi:sulfur carrier protein ThiS